MNKRMNDEQATRERAVYDYLQSLENGDIDGIIDALEQATYDAPLDQMLVDAHHAYFQDEPDQQRTLADADTHEIAVLEPATLVSHGAGHRQSRKTRRPSPWLQALVAVLLLGLIVSSFLALVALRRSGSSSPSTPTVTPACQSYPFKQFDAQNHGNTADSLNSLAAVTIVSASDAWAVGASYRAPTAPPHNSTFIEHWDGRSWQIVPSPNSADGNDTLLTVAAVSSSDVWAAGYSIHGTSSQGSESSMDLRTLIEHWDGKQWRVVPSPNGPNGKGVLDTLAAISGHDIWAAGSFPDTKSKSGLFYPLLEHWDGTGWRVVSLEGSSTPTGTAGFFKAMSVLASNDVWAVGTGRNANEQRSHGLIEHWNGNQWTSVAAPPNSSILEGISALSAHDIWVIGGDTNGHPLIAQWDGQRWITRDVPASLAKQVTNLPGLSAISNEDIWAAGSIHGSDQVNHLLILHWNGKAWQQISPPALQESYNLPGGSASGIAVDGEHHVWVVGAQQDSEGGYTSSLILGQSTCP